MQPSSTKRVGILLSVLRTFTFLIEYRDDSIIAEVVRIIGHKNDVGIDILSICDNKIEPEFSKEILDFAHDISKDIPEEERKKEKTLLIYHL